MAAENISERERRGPLDVVEKKHVIRAGKAERRICNLQFPEIYDLDVREKAAFEIASTSRSRVVHFRVGKILTVPGNDASTDCTAPSGDQR